MRTYPLGPFRGINNRLPDFALIADKRTGECYVRSADNVDIDKAGKFKRRAATARVQALTNAHSLHMLTPTTGVLVRGAVLYSVALPTYSEVLLKVLVSDAPMSYAMLGGVLYMSNGVDSLRLVGGAIEAMALPTPDSPALEAIAGGLLAGRYQVAVSYRTGGTATAGEEGGCSASANITLVGATGGIRVTLPGAVPGATHIAVYLSEANGAIPFLSVIVPVGTATADLSTDAGGYASSIRFEEPLPAGELFTSNGRLCSITNDIYGYRVNIGIAFRPGYFLPVEGYIPFTEPVTMAVENQGGTFIAADKTYWVPGDLGAGDEKLVTVLPYGAVQGTAFALPDRSVVGWFGEKGIVLGSPTGEADAVMAEAVDLVPPASGRSIVLEEDGLRRVVSCGWCVNLETKWVTTYSGWDFSSLSEGYGTKADGVFQLVATGAVDADIGFGRQDFGTEARKYLPAVYIGTDSVDAMNLRVMVPGGGDYTYPSRGSSVDLQIQRVDTGRGLNANWFDVHIMNQNGADFTLASVSFAPTASTRRI